MRIPRDVSGMRLDDLLCRNRQYVKVHPAGSRIILKISQPTP